MMNLVKKFVEEESMGEGRKEYCAMCRKEQGNTRKVWRRKCVNEGRCTGRNVCRKEGS
jgi:hypothetical protein